VASRHFSLCIGAGMKILIVEDELPISNYISDLLTNILDSKIETIYVKHTLKHAIEFIKQTDIDLCLLDLNLNGKSGFSLLKEVVSYSFHTIIISANKEQAAQAFEYGVLDFVTKPFDRERLEIALDRYLSRKENHEISTRYLSVRKSNQISVIDITNITHLKAAGVYVEAHLENGSSEFLDKSMERVLHILPPRFIRIHRSYIVDLTRISGYRHAGGGNYEVILKSEKTLPLSRQKYKELQEVLNY
jgi:two-component system response regulator LytT